MLVKSELRNELRRLHLFSALDEAELDSVLSSATRQHLEPGESLFAQGDPAERFYWLRRGLMKLTRLSPDGEEKVVELIRPGHTFGEAIAFMERQRYPVNAEAIDASDLVGVECARFRELMHSSTDICFRVLGQLSMRLHRHIDEIDRLTLQNATTRVVAYLLQAREPSTELVKLGMPKHLLASRLSIQPETLSRIFSRLAKAGLITVEGQNVVLNDLEGLRRQAHL